MATRKSNLKKKVQEKSTMIKIAGKMGKLAGKIVNQKNHIVEIADHAIESVKEAVHDITSSKKTPLKKVARKAAKPKAAD